MKESTRHYLRTRVGLNERDLARFDETQRFLRASRRRRQTERVVSLAVGGVGLLALAVSVVMATKGDK